MYLIKIKPIKAGQNGFTLIEIIIVLFIIGLASGLVAILFGSRTDNLEIRTFTKDISSVFRYARNQAVSEKKTYCFVIDKDEGMIRLYSDKGSGVEEDRYTIVIDRAIPEGIHMSMQGEESDSPFIEFFPKGNSTGGVIELKNLNNTKYLVTVNTLSGKVEVEKERGAD